MNKNIDTDSCVTAIKCAASPAEVPEKYKKYQDAGFKGLISRIQSWLFGYSIDDIGRVKEAGVQIV